MKRIFSILIIFALCCGCLQGEEQTTKSKDTKRPTAPGEQIEKDMTDMPMGNITGMQRHPRGNMTDRNQSMTPPAGGADFSGGDRPMIGDPRMIENPTQ